MTRSLLFFAIAGAIGFLVDVSIFLLFKEYLGLYISRGISFFCAVFSTWIFNKLLTFKGRVSGYSLFRELCAYFAAMLIGGSVNYIVYAVLISFISFFAVHPVLAIAAGSSAGMILNWVSSHFLIFRKVDNK